MGRVLGDSSRREEMVSAGRERARTFSWRRAARSFLDIFGSCDPALIRIRSGGGNRPS
jgi:hypothetical protein